MIQDESAHELQEATLWDSTGHRLGLVGEVHRDKDTGRLAWLTVALGPADTRERFVPLTGARIEGTDVYVAYDHDTIKGSPDIDNAPEAGLSPEDEAKLHRYYGL
ncbi:PRC-barrel domain-containing protein [Arthrobacter mobilis]|uniref:PRC-barrel domain containing protein n=1 Tax=Arthrobacter mobilis TaxID=2724944 RepID=A0A7X6HE10_9MICC|nr:PRC-barrel domain-containing protein [Arthrobacter mobilis]NKX53927.1 PRC-barrel domain containing protein [Arthrobacter mobilis]